MEVFSDYSTFFEILPAIFGFLFSVHFLHLKDNLPISYKIVLGMIYAQVVLLILSLMGLDFEAHFISNMISALFIPLALFLGYRVWKTNGYEPAKYYLLSWSFVFAWGIHFFHEKLWVV